jgi:hypothetical protein
MFGPAWRTRPGSLSRPVIAVLASLVLVGGLAAVPNGFASHGSANEQQSSDEQGSGDNDCENGDAVQKKDEGGTQCAEDNDADDQSGAAEDNDADDQPGAAEDNDADDQGTTGATGTTGANGTNGTNGTQGTSGVHGTTTTGQACSAGQRTRRFRLHHARHLKSATVKLNGHRVRRLRGRSLRRPITLANLPVGRDVVKIRGRTKAGKRRHGRRVFNICNGRTSRHRHRHHRHAL